MGCDLNFAEHRRYLHAMTGMRWMPWRHRPMKGVASCEKRRWAAGRQGAVDTRMGQPGGGHAPSPLAELIGEAAASGGTETSKHPGRGVKELLKPHTSVLSKDHTLLIGRSNGVPIEE